jgi:hypothetical protein
MTDVLRTTLLAIAIAMAAPAAAFATEPVAQGARQPIDGQSRHGMEEIRLAITEALPAVDAGRLDAAGFARLADRIADHAQQMAANSRLPAELKAPFVAYLERLKQAAAELKAKGSGAMSEVVALLDEYGRVFEHAGWPEKVAESSRR